MAFAPGFASQRALSNYLIGRGQAACVGASL
jgi:hypothetical protein